MKEINQAYGVLGDKEKRQNYDRYGDKEPFSRSSNSSGFGGFDNSADFFEEILSGFGFGGEIEFGKKKSRATPEFETQPGNDLIFSLLLTFKESVLGTKKKISFDLEKPCPDCRQSGAHSAADIRECSTCQGRGIVNTTQRTILGFIPTQMTCPRCQGQRKIITKKCQTCLGRKFVIQKEIMEINIPRGIQPDQKLRYQGVGNHGLYGSRGDIYIKIKVQENSYFQRKVNDVYVSLPISFLDAILGHEAEVITLEGVEKILIPAGTQNDDYLVLRNRGCYLAINKNSRGDLYVLLKIKMPKKITKETRETLQNFQTKTNWNPNRVFIEKNRDL